MSPLGRVLVDITPLRRYPQFRLLWGGQVVSFIGSQLTAVAVPYQVYRLTHSSLQVGLVSLVQLVPLLAGSLFGGAVVDSLERRRLLLATQAVMTATSVGLVVNAFARHPALWPIYLLSAASAGVSGVDSPTRSALIANLVPRESYPSAYALWQLLVQVGLVAGPAVAGVLIGAIGLGGVYLVDVGSFLVALGAVAGLRPVDQSPDRSAPGLKAVRQGLGFLRGKPVLQANFLIDIDAMVFGMPRALFPAIGLGRFHGGAGTVGALYSAPGIGALVAVLLTGWVPGVRFQGRAVMAAVAAWGMAVIGFGLSPVLPLAMSMLALAGAADVVSAVFRNTILQLSVPDRLRGRLSAVHTAVVTGGPRLGDLESGGVASLAGATFAVVSGGVACLVGLVALGLALPAYPRFHLGSTEVEGSGEVDGLEEPAVVGDE
jgi:hypothetical protein